MALTKKTYLSLAVVGGLAVVAIAVARNGDGPSADRPASTDEADLDAELGRPMRYRSNLCKRLRCTVEQDGQVLDIIEKHRELSALQQREITTIRQGLSSVYINDELDDAAMRAVFGEIAEHEGVVALHAYESVVTLHSLLSPEQRETFGRMLDLQKPEDIFGRPGDAKRRKGRGDKRDAQAARAARDAMPRDARRDAAARGRDPADAEMLEARRRAAESRRAAAAAEEEGPR